MVSFTACRSFCFDPRYRSVVSTDTWPSRNWICSSSPPATWQSRAHVRRRSCWRERFDPGFRSRGLDDLPDHLGSDAATPDAPGSMDRAEDLAARDSSCVCPFIDSALDPHRHRDSANVIGLAVEIGDHPVFFSQLGVLHRQGEQLTSTQAASDKNREYGPVAASPPDSRRAG